MFCNIGLVNVNSLCLSNEINCFCISYFWPSLVVCWCKFAFFVMDWTAFVMNVFNMNSWTNFSNTNSGFNELPSLCGILRISSAMSFSMCAIVKYIVVIFLCDGSHTSVLNSRCLLFWSFSAKSSSKPSSKLAALNRFSLFFSFMYWLTLIECDEP